MNPKSVIQDFLDLIEKIPHKSSFSKLETCLLTLSKLKLDKTEANILMDGILVYIDVVINISAKRSLREQIKICRQWFDVLQDFINDDIRELFVKTVTQKIFDILIEEDVSSWCVKKHLLRMFVSCIQDVPKLVKCKIVENLPDIYLFKIVDSISTYGDYDFQATLIELVFRMYGKTVVVSKLPALIPESQELSESFAKINGETFDEDVRKFLNALNENTKKVFSIVCTGVIVGSVTCGEPMENVNGLWVDFNRSENAVSWYCTQESLGEDEDGEKVDAGWNLVTFFVSDVDVVRILRPPKSDDAIIYVKLKTPCIFSQKSTIMRRAGEVKFLVQYGSPETRVLIAHVLPGMFKHKFEHNTPKLSLGGRTVYKPLHISMFKKTKSESSKSKSDISGFTAVLEPISKNVVRNDPNRVRSVSSGVSCCEVISISDSSEDGVPMHRESQYETAQMCPLEQLGEKRRPPKELAIKIISGRCSDPKAECNRQGTKCSVNAAQSRSSQDSEAFETAQNFSSGYLKKSTFMSVTEAKKCLVDELPLEDVLEGIGTVRNGETTSLEQRKVNLSPKCSASEEFSKTSLSGPEEIAKFENSEQFESISLRDILEQVKNNKRVEERHENADYEQAVSENSVSDVEQLQEVENFEKVKGQAEQEMGNEKSISEESCEAVVNLVKKSDEIIALDVPPMNVVLISEEIKIVDVPTTNEDRALKNDAAIENVDLHPNAPDSKLKISHTKVSESEKLKTEPPKRKNRKFRTTDDEVPQNNAELDFGVVEPDELISESKMKITKMEKTKTGPPKGRSRKIPITQDQVPEKDAAIEIADSNPNKTSREQMSEPEKPETEPQKRKKLKIPITAADEVPQNSAVFDFGVAESNELISESKVKISETRKAKAEPLKGRNQKIPTTTKDETPKKDAAIEITDSVPNKVDSKLMMSQEQISEPEEPEIEPQKRKNQETPTTDDKVPQNNAVFDFAVVEPNKLFSESNTKISETGKTKTEPPKGRNRTTKDEMPKKDAAIEITDSDPNKVDSKLTTSQAKICEPGKPEIEPQKRKKLKIPITTTDDKVPQNNAPLDFMVAESNKLISELKTKISETRKTKTRPPKGRNENIPKTTKDQTPKQDATIEIADSDPNKVNSELKMGQAEIFESAKPKTEPLKQKNRKIPTVTEDRVPKNVAAVEIVNSNRLDFELKTSQTKTSEPGNTEGEPSKRRKKNINRKNKKCVSNKENLSHLESVNDVLRDESNKIETKVKRIGKEPLADRNEKKKLTPQVILEKITTIQVNNSIETSNQEVELAAEVIKVPDVIPKPLKDTNGEENVTMLEETTTVQVNISRKESIQVVEATKVVSTEKECVIVLQKCLEHHENDLNSSIEAEEFQIRKTKRKVRQLSTTSSEDEEQPDDNIIQATPDTEDLVKNVQIQAFPQKDSRKSNKPLVKRKKFNSKVEKNSNDFEEISNLHIKDSDQEDVPVAEDNKVSESSASDDQQAKPCFVLLSRNVGLQEIRKISSEGTGKENIEKPTEDEAFKKIVLTKQILNNSDLKIHKKKVQRLSSQSTIENKSQELVWDCEKRFDELKKMGNEKEKLQRDLPGSEAVEDANDVNVYSQETEKLSCEIHQKNDVIPEIETDTTRPEINKVKDVPEVWNQEIQPASALKESKQEEEIKTKVVLNQTLSTTLGGRKKRKLFDPNDLSHLDSITLADEEPEKPIIPKKVEKRNINLSKPEKKVEPNQTRCQKRKANTTKYLKNTKKPKRSKITNPDVILKCYDNVLNPTSVFYEMLRSFRKESNRNFDCNFPIKSKKKKTNQPGKPLTKKNTAKQLERMNAIMRDGDKESDLSDASFKLRRQRHNSSDSALLDEQVEVPPPVQPTEKIKILSHIKITPKGTYLQEVPTKKRRISKNLDSVAEVPVVAENITDQEICQWIKSGSPNYTSQSISERRIILKHSYLMFRSALGANDGSQEYRDMLSICRKLKKYI